MKIFKEQDIQGPQQSLESATDVFAIALMFWEVDRPFNNNALILFRKPRIYYDSVG